MENEQISIDNFRNELDEDVIGRGWIYFNNGWVNEPRELMPGYFEIVVSEVNPHAVSYSLNEDGTFTDIFCTCDDKQHSVCRHAAAMLIWHEAKKLNEEKEVTWEDIEQGSIPQKQKSKT
jgi:uncharacterized Zn finger protein